MSTWRDVYSLAVRWRQVSEPCDSVVWVDMLRFCANSLYLFILMPLSIFLMFLLRFSFFFLFHVDHSSKNYFNCSEREFVAGFGSHTPMVLGQAQVVRYYPNFERYVSVYIHHL